MKDTLTIFNFAGCTLNAAERTLSQNGQQIAIPSKTFDVLLLLVKNYGEIVTKDEILNEVWDGSFVEEGNLSVHVSKLRKLLGSTATQPHIKTVTGRGYQFVAKVEYDGNASGSQVTGKLFSPPNSNNSFKPDSIAILPLRNENGDEEIDYLADGLTESLINSLSYMPDFRVLARDTVFRYKNKDVDAQEVGQTLGVATVLTGRLRVIKDRLIIGVELINVEDGTQIWGTQLNQPFSNIFEVQEKLTNSISESLLAKTQNIISESLTKETTQNPESYRLYLKGKHLLQTKTYDNLKLATKYFHDSVSIDPANAHSYIALGECYFWLCSGGWTSASQEYPVIRKFVSRADEINPEIPELYVLKGDVAKKLEWDFEKSEKHYKSALSLKPNHPDAHRAYSHLLSYLGRFSEAFAVIGHLKRLEPVSSLDNVRAGQVFYSCGQYQNAILELEEALELDPLNFVAHAVMGCVYIELGEYKKAMECVHQALNIQNHAEFEVLIAYAYARSGNVREAHKILAELIQKSRSTYIPYMQLGRVYGALGEIDKAFEYLELAFNEREEAITYLKADPRFANLRSDPRFNDLLRRIGLPVD